MAGACSFDITTGCDLQEVDNAVNQTRKEIGQRYDFKGLDVKIDLRRPEDTLVVTAPDEFKLKSLVEVLESKLVRRKVPLKNLRYGNVERAGGDAARQEIVLQQGISSDVAREIVKFIKNRKLKQVQAAIQADQVRISSSSRDQLQEVIRMLKEQDVGVELRFGNYRG